MNSDDAFLRAALYEQCAKSSVLKHVDLVNATNETLLKLLNKDNVLMLRKLPIILSKMAVKYALEFLKRNVSQLNFLTPEQISVRVENDELQYLLESPSAMKPNLIFMVSKNVLLSLLGSSIREFKDDLLKNKLDLIKISVKSNDTPWSDTKSPQYYTDVFSTKVSPNQPSTSTANYDNFESETFKMGTRFNSVEEITKHVRDVDTKILKTENHNVEMFTPGSRRGSNASRISRTSQRSNVSNSSNISTLSHVSKLSNTSRVSKASLSKNSKSLTNPSESKKLLMVESVLDEITAHTPPTTPTSSPPPPPQNKPHILQDIQIVKPHNFYDSEGEFENEEDEDGYGDGDEDDDVEIESALGEVKLADVGETRLKPNAVKFDTLIEIDDNDEYDDDDDII